MSFLAAHSTIIALGSYIVFSCAVSSMPSPRENSSEFYQWFFKFANALASNISAIRGRAAFEATTSQTQTSALVVAKQITTTTDANP